MRKVYIKIPYTLPAKRHSVEAGFSGNPSRDRLHFHDKVLRDMFVEREFAEQLLNSISQRETLRASATSISVPLACRPLFS
jgi:hypothetical protein